jgi:hypothetical protein
VHFSTEISLLSCPWIRIQDPDSQYGSGSTNSLNPDPIRIHNPGTVTNQNVTRHSVPAPLGANEGLARPEPDKGPPPPVRRPVMCLISNLNMAKENVGQAPGLTGRDGQQLMQGQHGAGRTGGHRLKCGGQDSAARRTPTFQCQAPAHPTTMGLASIKDKMQIRIGVEPELIRRRTEFSVLF